MNSEEILSKFMMMKPNFYVENRTDDGDMTDTSYYPPAKKFCQPMDLSRRDSVKTSSLCSDRSFSPTETSLSISRLQSLQNELLSSHNKQPSPDFAFFGSELQRLPESMVEAAMQLMSNASAIDYLSVPDSMNEQQIAHRDGKIRRPFKAFPDEHSMERFGENDNTTEKYEKFRQEHLKRIGDSRGGQLIVTNPNMRRSGIPCAISKNVVDNETNGSNSDSSSSCVKDSAYLERREKNNAAAKRSRDRRKMKEDEIAIRASFLENENRQYKSQLCAASHEMDSLKNELALIRSKLVACCSKDCTKE